ncbi:MAG: hypothetical protein COU47_00780 [Candidatus Niyogibacteria bacterium CG10_big_fil_rev_8_21_14_0_10_46_36]|uniref:NAD-dependent epimerase/dehydratase domain-containing protein n=1 Tax=Candidatus Niyogibacteria bacterium CG10_big_fil_rev_8_21_14_0_10_46_36 TaxID=1974726 RepID=A0A2H0TEH9_9BACT|nr:MAG: hypothetical protein COU47_00780 [Candidatus Niyogibacteria bacterium CG10_big_fil_rev_8_21_14_0_10_46_36]
MKFDFTGKNVLVAGGTGLIGTPLVRMLIEKGANVTVASLDDPSRAHSDAAFVQTDLRSFEACLKVCAEMDYVFNLLCVKGSPLFMKEHPARVFVSHIQFNTNLMEAARLKGVSGFLYTSTVGVYAPSAVMQEDSVWHTFPSEHDKFAGWAKRMGELQAEAYGKEYGWNAISIVRPANVYGPHDTFDPESAMVIPSLIARAMSGEGPFVVWGDGSAVRDFIYADDVARGMLFVAEHGITKPVNIGSGVGVSIRELVEVIISCLPEKPTIVWDTEKPTGDAMRILDTSRVSVYGWKPAISLKEGIAKTIKWYEKNHAA